MHHDARSIGGTNLKKMRIGEEVELRLVCDRIQLEVADELPILKTYARGEDRISNLLSIYYDTAGHDLKNAGLSLRVRLENAHFVMTVKPLAHRGAGLRREEREIEITGMQPEVMGLRSILDPQIFHQVETKVLKPIFSTEVRRRTRMLYLATGIVELAIDDGQIIADGRHEPICEVELELIEGRSVAIWELTEGILKEGSFRPSVRSKAIRGFDLAENHAPRLPPAPPTAVGKADTLQAFFRVASAELVGRLMELQPVAEDGSDHEAIHQYRITLRRLRTLFGIARRLAPGSKAMDFDKDAKWLLAETADARMSDVFLHETIPQVEMHCCGGHDFAAIKSVAETLHVRAYERAHASLISPRTSRFQIEAMVWIEHCKLRHEASPQGVRMLHAAVDKISDKILERQYRRLRKRGKGFRGLSNEERHQVRLAAKTLRYTIDFLEPALRGKSNKSRFLRRLSSLQRQLGALNDTVTTPSLLTQIIERELRPGVHYAAGVIAGWQAANLDHNAARLRSSWRRFRATPVPWSQ